MTDQLAMLPPARSAVISACGRYRYRLDRRFRNDGPVWAFLLHNPSTADDRVDDATTRRCIGFAAAWGASSLVQINRFSGRARHPADLWKMLDPAGPENDRHIGDVALEVAGSGGGIVVAWGSFGGRLDLRRRIQRQNERVLGILHQIGAPLRVLRLTTAGVPEHPLYLPADLRPVPWLPARETVA